MRIRRTRLGSAHRDVGVERNQQRAETLPDTGGESSLMVLKDAMMWDSMKDEMDSVGMVRDLAG